MAGVQRPAPKLSQVVTRITFLEVVGLSSLSLSWLSIGALLETSLVLVLDPLYPRASHIKPFSCWDSLLGPSSAFKFHVIVWDPPGQPGLTSLS